ncbi:MAG: cytochrome c [Candidatus Scalindua sp.]
MRHSLIALVIILGIFIITTFCKTTEGVEIKKVENVTKVSEGNSLSAAGKKASLEMRRLSRAAGSNDWTKMDMWLQELKHGMGFNCMKLYMIENHNIPDEFVELSNKFNSAINKLILCGKKQDTENVNLEFDNLVKSCDACHESYNKDAEGLDFTDSGGNS